jgi:hypothetical protein
MLAAAGASAPADETPKPGSTPSAAPVLAGVLYTRGTAQVDWNGEKISVADGSYAYLGGEVVSNGPGDMGVLRLDENNSVYMCPGSRMSVDRTDGGGYRIKIFQGGGRFAFAAGTPVIVSDQVNLHNEIVSAKVGSVVPTNLGALSAEIRSWLNGDRRRELAVANARNFLKAYDLEVIATRWMHRYRLLSQHFDEIAA